MCTVTALIELKRLAAIAYLGRDYLLHPLYNPAHNPHHALTHRHSARLEHFCDAMQQHRQERNTNPLIFFTR